MTDTVSPGTPTVPTLLPAAGASPVVPPQARRTPEVGAAGAAGAAGATDALDVAVADLRATLPGRVSAPGDAAWDLARLPWALTREQHPVAVVSVASTDDVVAAVACATRHGLTVSAQPVGHGATEALSGTVLLRTGGLQDVEVDAAARTIRVGAGVKWGTALEAAEPTGMLLPAGSSTDPTVVGFTLGGGLSWFSRAHGLAAQHVTALEVVGADAVARRVSADSDPDLFWAMCGGGGDFGIVTALEMRLTEAPPVVGGRLMWPIEMARPVLHAYRELTHGAPEELSTWAHLFRFPPLPELPEPIRGRSFVSVDLTWLGEAAELDELLLPLRTLPALVVDTVDVVPLGRLGDIAAEPVDPMPALETAGLLADLDAATVDRLVAVAGADAQVPLNVVQLRHLGGALARATDADGPQGAITEEYLFFSVAVLAVPELAGPIAAAFTALQEAMAPQATGRGFFNFLGEGTEAASCYTPAALERLRAVKAAVDPDGRFRSNRPTP